MWRPSPAQAVQLAAGEAIVDWSAATGWRVVPLRKVPKERETREGSASARSGAPESDRLRAPSDIGSGSLTPAEIARLYPAAARRAGIR